jgi:chromodomain-helicase-DNA-binding protein 1
VEYYECQLELQQDLAKSYTSAERIIGEFNILTGIRFTWNRTNLKNTGNTVVIIFYGKLAAEHRNEENEVEYFVKWDCLPYSDATWENGALIASRNPEVIEIYKRREASNRTPASSTKSLRSRPKFTQIKTQPEYMTGDSNVNTM